MYYFFLVNLFYIVMYLVYFVNLFADYFAYILHIVRGYLTGNDIFQARQEIRLLYE